MNKHYWSPTFHLFSSALSCFAFQLNPATDRKDTLFYVWMSENSRERSQAKLCETNLNLPHQKRYKGSVHAALDDENTVGELGSVCDPQIVVCRKSKHSDEGFKQETSSALCGDSLYLQLLWFIHISLWMLHTCMFSLYDCMHWVMHWGHRTTKQHLPLVTVRPAAGANGWIGQEQEQMVIYSNF